MHLKKLKHGALLDAIKIEFLFKNIKGTNTIAGPPENLIFVKKRPFCPGADQEGPVGMGLLRGGRPPLKLFGRKTRFSVCVLNDNFIV